MAGSRLKIEVLPAGSVVPAFQLLDAVAKGTLDGGHGVVAYWYGKNSALALWGSGPGYGMDANMVLAWHNYGGGKALMEEIYKSLNLDVVSYLYGPMPTQPLPPWSPRPTPPAPMASSASTLLARGPTSLPAPSISSTPARW